MKAAKNFTCDNNSTSDFDVDNCEIICNVVFFSILCLVGFLGNFLTIAVLRRDRDPQRQKTTNWLLEALAVADTVFLAFAFLLWSLKSIASLSVGMPTFREVLAYTRVYLNPLALIAHMMTVWTVVLVTVDRYLAICKPLHPEWRSMRRAKMALGVLFILAVICNIPNFFEMEIRTKERCHDGELRNISESRRSDFGKSVYYMYIYEAGCDFVFRSVGPLVILVVLNVRISWAIRELNKKQHMMTPQAKEEKTLTVMMIIVVVIFLICQIPMSVISIGFWKKTFAPDDTEDWKPVIRCARKAAKTLLVLNSSINFLVYCLIWRKFNRVLVRMMACRRNKSNVPI